jgi:archaellum component FlaC
MSFEAAEKLITIDKLLEKEYTKYRGFEEYIKFTKKLLSALENVQTFDDMDTSEKYGYFIEYVEAYVKEYNESIKVLNRRNSKIENLLDSIKTIVKRVAKKVRKVKVDDLEETFKRLKTSFGRKKSRRSRKKLEH